METTVRFSASNRCGNTLPRSSDCSFKVHKGWWKGSGRNFGNWKFENVFASEATTRESLDKWIPQFNSAGQKGQKYPSTGSLSTMYILPLSALCTSTSYCYFILSLYIFTL